MSSPIAPENIGSANLRNTPSIFCSRSGISMSNKSGQPHELVAVEPLVPLQQADPTALERVLELVLELVMGLVLLGLVFVTSPQ